jgi:hypothetical protein
MSVPSKSALSDPDNWDKDITNYVYFRWNRRWNVWVSIKESRLVSAHGPQLDYGLGLFARRNFRIGDRIGFYSGRRLTRRQAIASESVYVVSMVDPRDGFSEIFVNGQNGTTGYIQFANDPRGTTSEANAVLEEDGFLIAIRPIRIGQEILWCYGNPYWED